VQLKIKLFVNGEDVLFVFFFPHIRKKIIFSWSNLAMNMSYMFNFN